MINRGRGKPKLIQIPLWLECFGGSYLETAGFRTSRERDARALVASRKKKSVSVQTRKWWFHCMKANRKSYIRQCYSTLQCLTSKNVVCLCTNAMIFYVDPGYH